MERIRLLIVEDDSFLLENLKLILSDEAGITVAAAVGSAEEAMTALKTSSPDAMLTDLGLPKMSGIDLIRKAKAEMPELDIIAFTAFDDRETVLSAIKAGASGYILKGCSARELVEALQNLFAGGSPMSSKIARAVIMEFQGSDMKEQYLLTPREKEILIGTEKGLSYKELADKLNISPHTIHTHIKKIYEKLHAKDRKEALLSARKKGII